MIKGDNGDSNDGDDNGYVDGNDDEWYMYDDNKSKIMIIWINQLIKDCE